MLIRCWGIVAPSKAVWACAASCQLELFRCRQLRSLPMAVLLGLARTQASHREFVAPLQVHCRAVWRRTEVRPARHGVEGRSRAGAGRHALPVFAYAHG